jgi:hypothetical protein
LPWRLTEVAAAGALAGVLMILAWLDLRPDLSVAAASNRSSGSRPPIPPPSPVLRPGHRHLDRALADKRAASPGRRGRPGQRHADRRGVQASGMAPGALKALYWPNGDLHGQRPGHRRADAGPGAAGLRDVDLERPALTGFACGLFCGGVAATVDGLHCWQETYAFVGPWFTLAMLVSGGIGAGVVKLLAVAAAS